MTNFNPCFLMDVPRNIILEPVADDNFVPGMQNLEMFNLGASLTNNDDNMYSTAAYTQSGTTANVEVFNDISPIGPGNIFMEHQTVNFNTEVNAPGGFQLATSNEVSDSRCCSLSSCKCYQKLCNKMEWLHKKIFNEFNSIRGEILTNRQMFLDYTSRQQQGGEQPVVVQDEEKENMLDLTDDEVDTFNATFKRDFPVSSSDALVEFNETDDEKFKKFVLLKLEKLQGDDDTKTVRKILKSLCDVHCMSQYTWFGTKKKKSFSKLQSVVDMIVGIMETKYPKCDANELLKVVVQQRTKSAAEKVDKINSQSTAAGPSQSAQSNDNSNGTSLPPSPSTEQSQTFSVESVSSASSQLVNRQDTVINDADQNLNDGDQNQ